MRLHSFNHSNLEMMMYDPGNAITYVALGRLFNSTFIMASNENIKGE
jgi:hypothetical protein